MPIFELPLSNEDSDALFGGALDDTAAVSTGAQADTWERDLDFQKPAINDLLEELADGVKTGEITYQTAEAIADQIMQDY